MTLAERLKYSTPEQVLLCLRDRLRVWADNPEQCGEEMRQAADIIDRKLQLSLSGETKEWRRTS